MKASTEPIPEANDSILPIASSINASRAGSFGLSLIDQVLVAFGGGNACAHGNVLYGLRLSSGIITGAACPSFAPGSNQTFNGALRVIDYLLRQISVNRAKEMWSDLYKVTARLGK